MNNNAVVTVTLSASRSTLDELEAFVEMARNHSIDGETVLRVRGTELSFTQGDV